MTSSQNDLQVPSVEKTKWWRILTAYWRYGLVAICTTSVIPLDTFFPRVLIVIIINIIIISTHTLTRFQLIDSAHP